MTSTEKKQPSLFNEDNVNIEHDEYFEQLNPYPTDTVDYLEDRSDDEENEEEDPYPKPTVDPFEEDDNTDLISKLNIKPKTRFDYFEDEYEFYHEKDISFFDKVLEYGVPSFNFTLLIFTSILLSLFFIF